MRCVHICRAVDEANPAVAIQVRWIAALAAHPSVEHVTVLAPRVREATLPGNVTVEALGRGRSFGVALRLWRGVLRARRDGGVDFVFVCQGGWWPALLLPLKLVLGFALYQWKAQPTISRGMRFCARWCDDLVFTATPGSFPMAIDTVRAIGHGIDTAAFAPDDAAPERDVLLLGRIAPGKRIEDALRAVALVRERTGKAITLDVVGPCIGSNRDYLEGLRREAEALGIGDQVRFSGPVGYEEIPELLRRYRVTANFSTTAFDKVAGESMACGVPVVTTNPCAAEVIPEALWDQLVVAPDDVDAQATALHAAVVASPEQRAAVGAALRAVVVEHHGLDTLFVKILDEVDRARRQSSKV